jgi:hypothetical protein
MDTSFSSYSLLAAAGESGAASAATIGRIHHVKLNRATPGAGKKSQAVLPLLII